jgi:hypothetical protein
MVTMADAPPLHPDLAPLAFLLGSWRGRGHGDYPTIGAFEYLEVATFSHVGKPFIAYSQRTSDATTGAPLHAETGYLRPVDAEAAEFVVVQPSGIVELHDVVITATSLTMVSNQVVTTRSAKRVDEVRRRVVVDGDRLDYELDMAAVGQPMQRHLVASLER